MTESRRQDSQDVDSLVLRVQRTRKLLEQSEKKVEQLEATIRSIEKFQSRGKPLPNIAPGASSAL